ncbi:MAG: HEPN domain-containing protein [Promethearchaeati archaeon SRVP18_Atabeyarchaeia-1]
MGIAKKDLQAARCLLKEKLYAQAVFYLQQSVEKAVKSLGIWDGKITEVEARSEIGHKTIRIYFRIFGETKDKLIAFEKALLMFPDLRKLAFLDVSQVARLKRGIDAFRKEFSDENVALRISSSERDLQDFLRKLRTLKEELGNELTRIDKEFKELSANEKKSGDFKSKLSQVLEVGSQIRPIMAEGSTIEDVVDKSVSPEFIMILIGISKSMIRLSFCYQSLLYSCLILYPHAARTRYPGDDFNPTDFYNARAPLIQLLDNFIESTGGVLRELDLIYCEAPRFGKKR